MFHPYQMPKWPTNFNSVTAPNLLDHHNKKKKVAKLNSQIYKTNTLTLQKYYEVKSQGWVKKPGYDITGWSLSLKIHHCDPYCRKTIAKFSRWSPIQNFLSAQTSARLVLKWNSHFLFLMSAFWRITCPSLFYQCCFSNFFLYSQTLQAPQSIKIGIQSHC
jgi:hypothetical protein